MQILFCSLGLIVASLVGEGGRMVEESEGWGISTSSPVSPSPDFGS